LIGSKTNSFLSSHLTFPDITHPLRIYTHGMDIIEVPILLP
jgi:hypothetical protein